MTFTPEPHASWNSVPPLRSGLGIAEEGTLGIAVRLPSGRFFTSARHVVGDPPATPTPVSVFRSSGDWQTTVSLSRLDSGTEPGDPTLLARHDLALLLCTTSTANVTPDDTAALPSFGVVLAGDPLEIRGARHTDWIETTYQADFGPEHAPFFANLAAFSGEHYGIIDLAPLGTDAAQHGNSGSVLWIKHTGGYAAVGHLVAVSQDRPIALIITYRKTFQILGLGAAEVIA